MRTPEIRKNVSICDYEEKKKEKKRDRNYDAVTPGIPRKNSKSDYTKAFLALISVSHL